MYNQLIKWLMLAGLRSQVKGRAARMCVDPTWIARVKPIQNRSGGFITRIETCLTSIK
jgi:hypothetical protein